MGLSPSLSDQKASTTSFDTSTSFFFAVMHAASEREAGNTKKKDEGRQGQYLFFWRWVSRAATKTADGGEAENVQPATITNLL